MRTFGWVVRGLVLALLWVIVGCAASVAGRASLDDPGTPTAPAPVKAVPAAATDPASAVDLNGPVASTTDPPPVIPDGFTALETFGYRGLQTCPADKPRCVGIEIYSSEDCPAGATVVLEYYKEASHPASYLGVTSAVSPAIQPDSTGQIFIATPPELADTNPYGYVEAIDC